MHKGIVLSGALVLGAHDALALAGLSEPMGFSDGVLFCGALSWFVALPVAMVLSAVVAVLRAKRKERGGPKSRSAITFGISLAACLGLYAVAVVAFVSIGMWIYGG
jgi:hypothetical protein